MQTVDQIVEALDGSAAISRETGIPLTTIESWKAANFIPEWRREGLLSLAVRKGKPLSTGDFPPRKPRPSEQAAA